ncbi:GntR family transcriptional regulator [Pararhodobacter oceanensis]|uniref:GntR family transcriptional regulator n=1 Tax=Pararhodobacter oceanensis TaxID=2172121 RepID=UPI003A9388DA
MPPENDPESGPETGPESGTDATANPAQGADVYTRLRAAILTLDLLPGERLSERALEGMLGASRTPIREAVLRLETEGLIQRKGRVMRVTSLELAEILEAFEYREHIEAAVAQLACQHATKADITRLQKILDAGRQGADAAAWFEIGSDFHILLAELSRNRFLVRAVTDILTRIERARWIMCSLPSARDEAHDEHSQILRLIELNRPEQAAEALKEHGRGLRDILAESLSQRSRAGLRARGVDIIDRA